MHFSRIYLVVFFLVLVGFVFWGLSKREQVAVVSEVKKLLVTPTPAPYDDLTIPVLRTRTYQSKLGPREKLQDNESYTSYLTSYASDGLKINGLLTVPNGKPPAGGFPAIVFVHGYIPPKSYQTNGTAYARYVDYLAKNGFVVFKIDLRGHGDSEGQAEGAYYSSAYVIDTLNAYNALEKSGFVNEKKIGIWGHSMAGNVTLRAVATKPTVPALVIWAGAGYTYKDLVDYKISDASFAPNQMSASRRSARAQLQKMYGSPDPKKPFWHELAPVSYVTDFKGAVQLHHASDDAVVSIKYSEDLDKILSAAGVSHNFYSYPSGGHNISDENFTIAMQRSVEFFKKYLK